MAANADGAAAEAALRADPQVLSLELRVARKKLVSSVPAGGSALAQGAAAMCCSSMSLCRCDTLRKHVAVPVPAGASAGASAGARRRSERMRESGTYRVIRCCMSSVRVMRGCQSRWPGPYGDGPRARRSTRSGSWPRRTRTPPRSASARPPRRPRPPRTGRAARRAARASRCARPARGPAAPPPRAPAQRRGEQSRRAAGCSAGERAPGCC